MKPGAAVRQLGLFTVLCIGVNNIVGSGIYRKPSELALFMGGASWMAFAIDGLLLVTVALCFAAMSSRHGEAGGPYVYAKQAFGPRVAFVVAWTAWISMWAAMAASAAAIPGYLAVFVPGADSPASTAAIAIAIVLGFGVLNCVGVKPAAGAATFLTVAKLLPLLLFVGIGLLHVDWNRVDVVPRHVPYPALGFGSALFAAFYPLQGFEVVPVPAAELKRPQRDVPLSVVLSLLACSALYCLIQVVAVGTCRDLASMQAGGAGAAAVRPLAAAASTFLGAGGEKLMAAGACVSMLGFAAVTIFCAPRFLVALGGDGLLPGSFARHSSRGTPFVAVGVTTLAALLGALVTLVPALGGEKAFTYLTNLSNLAVLVQYGATCLAVIKLRAHEPAGPLGFRLPGGRFGIPVLGLGASGFLLFLVVASEDRVEQISVFLAWVIGGLLLSRLAANQSSSAQRA
jgi:amino acid transporter